MFTVCAFLCVALGGAQAVPHDTIDAAERALVIGQVLDSYAILTSVRRVREESKRKSAIGKKPAATMACRARPSSLKP